ncbi:hypothetical protein ARNL5_01424 [Anaerolineae bacterium]|nr:hypothetical protein [Anaerolinea sp.]MCC6974340.1 hypothetical protein [Anaerolineae bacterium]CAG0967915.1 hypothetical protein ARNL5_01424 [Anaerolineae bacterium]
MQVTLAYERRTAIVSDFSGSALDFATNTLRMPVNFRGTLREPTLMRRLMIAMHEIIISDMTVSRSSFLLDPVITVHPDEVFFEAFSNDGSVYVRLAADLGAFEVEEPITFGTTNVDFTFMLRNALQNLRTSRRTTFAVSAGGFEVATQVGANERGHFEQKVDLPDSWVKGFLQVSSALTMKPFTFTVRSVDLLNIINYFLENRLRKPPTALRYEFREGQPITAVLEPWEQRFILAGTEYNGYDRVIRVWGRKRLEYLRAVLPVTDKVTIGVLGRGLPHFYTCHCGPYRFTMVLSGWSRNDWASSGALDLLAPQTPISNEELASVYNYLSQQYKSKREEVEAHTLLDGGKAETALFRLCREGRAIYDPTTRRYRSRELFAEPLDWDTILAPDPRIARARAAISEGRVTIEDVLPSDVRPNEIKVHAKAQDGKETYEVLVAVDREGRIRFAQCGCTFFKENILSRGACEHILGARMGAEDRIEKLILAKLGEVV